MLAVVSHGDPLGLSEENREVAFVHETALLGDLADGKVAFLQQCPNPLQFRLQDNVSNRGVEPCAEVLFDIPA